MASLKPYATDIDAPTIITTDNVVWKNRNIHAVNKQINTKYIELKAECDVMIEQFEYNNLVYTKFNFEPIMGTPIIYIAIK